MDSQRKYSVGEIDAMRSAVEWSFAGSGPFNPEARAREVEDRLRTYMLNGTDPEELRRAAHEHVMAAANPPHGLTPIGKAGW